MNLDKQILLKEINLAGLSLPNRIVMAPLTRSRANNKERIPSVDMEGLYYEQRASAGLIISEGSQVSKMGVGYGNTPGIHSKEQIEGWGKVVTRVHNAAGRIFIQLWHTGRVTHPHFLEGKLPLAPSAIDPNLMIRIADEKIKSVRPQEMTLEDIDQSINEFIQAAKNALEAGFDGIEIHSSNGYLFHQFFTKCSNHRNDKYGGSIENRARFLFDVLDRMIYEKIPVNRIGIRLNPSLNGLFGITLDEETIPTFEHIVNRLNDYNLAYLHLSEPFNDVSELPFAVQNIAEHFRPIYKGNLIINTAFDREKGNKIIELGLADLVAYGRPFISNPDLVNRFRNNYPLSDWDSSTFYTAGHRGYTDYPEYTQRSLSQLRL